MAHSAGTQGPTRSKGSRQLTSTCGTPWHMGIGQVQTVASAVARRTRATAETAVSTIWSVCGRLWRFAYAFRTRAVAEAVAGLQIGRRLVPLRAPRKGPLATAQNRGRAEAHGPHRRLHWEAVQRRVAWLQGDLQACQLPGVRGTPSNGCRSAGHWRMRMGV